MVYALGVDRRLVEAQMAGTYRMRVRAQLQTMDHVPVRDLTGMRLDGDVQCQATRTEVSRSLSLSLFDPTDVLGLTQASTTAAGMNRMIQVWRGIYVDALDRWVDVPVFCGPISKPSRQGPTLSVDAQDKASLAMEPSATYTVKKGWNAAGAIRKLMIDVCGESRFRLASTSKKLGRDYVVSADASPWRIVQLICISLGWVAFYDGAGYLVCRAASTASVFEFRAGPGGTLTGAVQTGYWDQEIRNRVTVRGATVGGVQVTASATLAASHPLGPGALGRGGKPRLLTEIVEDTSVTYYSAAVALAKEKLDERSVQASTASFEALPVWHLQEFDAYTVTDPKTNVSTKARLSTFTIPLTCEGTMSVGYNARTPRSRLAMRITKKSKALVKAEARVRAARARARRAAAKKKAGAKK